MTLRMKTRSNEPEHSTTKDRPRRPLEEEERASAAVESWVHDVVEDGTKRLSRVRDQLFLPRREASDEEVLLRQRALLTDFDYAFSINLRYRESPDNTDVRVPEYGDAILSRIV